MKKKNIYKDFEKDLRLQSDDVIVKVVKHIQVKDHKERFAAFDALEYQDDTVYCTLTYTDGNADDFPSTFILNASSVMETNEDTWKAVVSIPVDPDSKDLVKEYIISFSLKKLHM